MTDRTVHPTRWILTVGLAALAVGAVFLAPRVQPQPAEIPPEATPVEAEHHADWCVRVGKLECCLAEDE